MRGRWVHLAFMWALACAMVAPLLFGVAYLPAMHALGFEAAHACACGMEKGKCGCPECEELERGEKRAHEEGIAIAKKTCRDEDGSIVHGALPLALHETSDALLAPSFATVSPTRMYSRATTRALPGPAPPPPRI